MSRQQRSPAWGNKLRPALWTLLALLWGCSDPATVTLPAEPATPGTGSETAIEIPQGLGEDTRLAPGSVQAPTTIMVLGDSISAAYGIQRAEGWVALLEAEVNRLGSEHRVVNASISGETTGGGLARLDQALQTHQPDILVVELGGNDGLRGYPVDRIEKNLRAIVEASQAAGARVVLVGMQIPPNYGPRYTRAFTGLFDRLADDYDVPLVDAFLEEIALAGNLMQADGIHPTAEAQPLLLRAIWRPLATLLRER
jgi:acyl-CoA thioesterase-1